MLLEIDIQGALKVKGLERRYRATEVPATYERIVAFFNHHLLP